MTGPCDNHRHTTMYIDTFQALCFWTFAVFTTTRFNYNKWVKSFSRLTVVWLRIILVNFRWVKSIPTSVGSYFNSKHFSHWGRTGKTFHVEEYYFSGWHIFLIDRILEYCRWKLFFVHSRVLRHRNVVLL